MTVSLHFIGLAIGYGLSAYFLMRAAARWTDF